MTILRKYQRKAVDKTHFFDGRCLESLEMGLGKSIISLAYASENPDAWPVLVICPASLKWNWQDECKKHMNWKAEILEGRKPPRNWKPHKQIVIINYDILPWWKDVLAGVGFGLAIVDECFPYNTPITTNCGQIKIGDIVENRLPVKILCRDNLKNKLTFRPVVHYIKNRLQTKMVTVKHSNGSFICTENHKIWTTEHGYVKAKELHCGNTLYEMWEQVLSNEVSKKFSTILRPRMRKRLAGRTAKTPCTNNLHVVPDSISRTRVESVTFHEQTNRSKCENGGALCKDGNQKYVYNIEVKDHHNYFADNILVANCQMVKSRTAKRTKAVRALCKGVPHALLLSGTPLTNRPAELWSSLNILRPDLFNSYFSFCMKFCKARKRPWGWEMKGAEHLDELHSILKSSCMIRVLKKDVLKQLPAKIRSVVPMEISDRKEYNKAFTDFVVWIRRFGKHKADNAARAHQLAKTNYLKRLAAKLKLPSVFEWVDNFLEETDGKLNLFAYHKSIIKAIMARYGKIACKIDGSTPKRIRTTIVDGFNRSKQLRIFVGQIDAAGVGLNITGSHTVAFAEFPWTPSQMEQCIDRCYGRLSDLHGASVFYLTAKGTIEEDICRLLSKKQRIIDATLDGDVSGTGLSVFDELLRGFQKTKGNK